MATTTPKQTNRKQLLKTCSSCKHGDELPSCAACARCQVAHTDDGWEPIPGPYEDGIMDAGAAPARVCGECGIESGILSRPNINGIAPYPDTRVWRCPGCHQKHLIRTAEHLETALAALIEISKEHCTAPGYVANGYHRWKSTYRCPSCIAREAVANITKPKEGDDAT